MKSLGTAPSIPQPLTDRGTTVEPPLRGGGVVPSDYEHLQRLDYWAALNALRDEKNRLEAEPK